MFIASHSEDDELGVVDTQKNPSIQCATFTRELWKLDPKMDGQGMIIAVIDSGIQESHLAFKNAILTKRSRQFCLDNCESLNYKDTDGHGTFCAGIAAGRSFEGEVNYPGGIAKGAQLVICKVCKSCESISPAAVIKALKYIVYLNNNNCHVHVVSISLGFTSLSERKKKEMENVINKLANDGTICVAAAGKKNSVLYPAKFQNTIAVGSHDQNKQPTPSSPVGSNICCLAPGLNIRAPTTHKDNAEALDANDGTSVATAAVAGLVVLIMQTHNVWEEKNTQEAAIAEQNVQKEKKKKTVLSFTTIESILKSMRGQYQVLEPQRFILPIFDIEAYVDYCCNYQ